MLPLFAEFFILVDFGVKIGEQTIDIIPDFIGYLLLLIFFVRALLDRRANFVPVLLTFLALCFASIEHISTKAYLLAAIRFFIPIILQFVVLLLAYRTISDISRAEGKGPGDEVLERNRKMLVLILLTICIIELGAAATQLFYKLHLILYLIKLALVFLLLFIERRIIRYRSWR